MKKFFVIALLCCSIDAHAADSIIGTWQGSQQHEGLPVVINLSIGKLKLKDRSSTLTYAMPRNCNVSFEYAGASEGQDIFYITGTGGSGSSWCKRALRAHGAAIGYMKLELASNGDLIYSLYYNGNRVEGGTAQRLK